MSFSYRITYLVMLAGITASGSTRWILNRQAKLPLTAVQFTFLVGTADDPKGVEGLAKLTASLLQEGGVKNWKGLPALTRADIQEALSLAGAHVGFSVDKHQTTVSVLAPATEVERVVKLTVQMLAAPAFEESQVKRLLGEAEEALAKQWPREDQEELGKAVLDNVMFGSTHPYAHVEEGTLSGLKKITRAAIEKFHRENFTADRLIVGMAGRFGSPLKNWIQNSLPALAKSKTQPITVAFPPVVEGLDLWLVKGDFQGTGVHFGVPIVVTRSHPDFPAIYLASAGLGKHRSFVGRLMKVVREVRGLNYGAYAYAENFPNAGRLLIPPTQGVRSVQAFTLWGRPTRPENGCFLVRQLWREVNSLVEKGLTDSEFSQTQSHLLGYVPELALSLDRQLGFAIDSLFYGVKGDYLKGLTAAVSKLDQKKVLVALGKQVKPQNFRIVVTTSDPETFKKAILSPSCPITYAEGITKSKEVLDEDKVISETNLPLTEDRIQMLGADAIFQ